MSNDCRVENMDDSFYANINVSINLFTSFYTAARADSEYQISLSGASTLPTRRESWYASQPFLAAPLGHTLDIIYSTPM